MSRAPSAEISCIGNMLGSIIELASESTYLYVTVDQIYTTSRSIYLIYVMYKTIVRRILED